MGQGKLPDSRAGETLQDILARLQARVGDRAIVDAPAPTPESSIRVSTSRKPEEPVAEPLLVEDLETEGDDPGRYEGHLAEFPVFIPTPSEDPKRLPSSGAGKRGLDG